MVPLRKYLDFCHCPLAFTLPMRCKTADSRWRGASHAKSMQIDWGHTLQLVMCIQLHDKLVPMDAHADALDVCPIVIIHDAKLEIH